MKGIIIGILILFCGLAHGQSITVHVYAVSVDSVYYDSLEVSGNYTEAIDFVYDSLIGDPIIIVLNDTLLTDFEVAILDNHRANMAYFTELDAHLYYYDQALFEVITLDQAYTTDDRTTFALIVTGLDKTDIKKLYLKRY